MKNTSKILALVLVVMTVLMSLSAITASAADETHVFDATTIEATSDQAAVSGAYDDYFAFSGTVTQRVSSGKVKSVELGKSSGGAIEFTTTGKATVTVSYSSTGGSNESFIVVTDANGNPVGEQASVIGTTAASVTYELTAVGTYKVVNPSSARNTRVYSVVVVTEIPAAGDCKHEGGTATCKELPVCSKCGEEYGALLAHTGGTATCKDLATCEACGDSYGKLADHKGGTATCVAKAVCEVCGASYGDLGDHTLTFVQTLPAGELKGKTTASCSVCDYAYESAEVGVMGKGTYVLEASSDLADIAAETFFDGEVKVVDGVFACHLSAKYKTDTSNKSWIDYDSGVRMNFGGASEFLNNGEGDEAVRNGGLKNYIQFTTTGETIVVVYWVSAGDGRRVALLDTNGNVIKGAISEESTSGGVYRHEFRVPAGTYLLGTDCEKAVKSGGSYFFKVVVDVHEHEWKDATCTSPKSCECGAEEGEALGHQFLYSGGACSRCWAAVDPDFHYNTLVFGENTVVVDNHHLVDRDGHGFPYQFTTFTVTEAGHYYFTSDKFISFTIYTTEVTSEGADFTAGTGASWAIWVQGGEGKGAELAPGTYYVGMVYMGGQDFTSACGEYKVTLNKAHVHSWSDATCTEPQKCECGETQGNALGHDYVDGVCSVCGAEDPNYVPPVELSIWDKIILWFKELIAKILGFFKKG